MLDPDSGETAGRGGPAGSRALDLHALRQPAGTGRLSHDLQQDGERVHLGRVASDPVLGVAEPASPEPGHGSVQGQPDLVHGDLAAVVKSHRLKRVAQGRSVGHGANPARPPPIRAGGEVEPPLPQPLALVRQAAQGPKTAPGNEADGVFQQTRREPGPLQVALDRDARGVQHSGDSRHQARADQGDRLQPRASLRIAAPMIATCHFGPSTRATPNP